MQITTVTVGPVATLCYLLSREGADDCLVIDPGDEPERILRAAAGKRIAAILLTHGHFDHIGAVNELLEKDTPLLIHELDAPMLTSPVLNASRQLLRQDISVSPVRKDGSPLRPNLLREGSRLSLAGLEIEVLHTPGHTPGSVCYRVEDALFTGDTLFEHGWGRTDLPGGNEHDLFASLRRLMPMTKTLPFYPGHDA